MGLKGGRFFRSTRLICASLIVLLLSGGFVVVWVLMAAMDSRTSFRVYGASGDQLGGTDPGGTAYGDVNGDGCDDLIVRSGTGFRAGAIYIVYGGDALRGQKLDFTDLAQSSRVTVLKASQTDNQHFMSAVSADFNGDGYDDVIFSLVSESKLGKKESIVCVFFGSPSLSGKIVELPSNFDVVDELCILLRRENAYLGTALAAGDVNGDGFADIIVNEFVERGVEESVGTIYVVFGRASCPRTMRLNDALAEPSITKILISESGYSGRSLASGDLNGDGFDDILIGYGWRWEPPERLIVLYGGPGLPGKCMELNSSTAHGTTHVTPRRRGDCIAMSIAVGDINADGFDDAILGAKATAPCGWEPSGYDAAFAPELAGNFGTVGLLLGYPTLPGAELQLDGSPGPHSITCIRGVDEGDGLGKSVSTCDIDGDGKDDVIFGASLTSKGTLVTVYTKDDLPDTELTLKEIDAIEIFDGHNGGDGFGHATVGGGDMNRDGVGDFGAASPYALSTFQRRQHQTGYFKCFFGAGRSPSATTIERFQSGNTQSRGFGGRLSPVLRCWIGFTGGDQESPVTVTLTRSSAGVAELTDLAEVVWEISTPRTGWTNAKIRLQYTDAEIAGLEEDTLSLYQAPVPSGPWRSVSNAQLNSHKNEFTAEVTEFGFFALRGRIDGQAEGRLQ